jgi:predicted RNA binding protein YcfA (HicA-like mRNA interferase family)
MSVWPAVKAKRVLAALFRLGWEQKRQTGSHRTLPSPILCRLEVWCAWSDTSVCECQPH